MLNLRVEEVFVEAFQYDNSYVDWVADLDCRAALKFLLDLAANWRRTLAAMEPGRLKAGLGVICLSGGLQWRVFNCGNAVSNEEKLALLDASSVLFFDFLISREDLEERQFMWWDDLAVQFAPDEPMNQRTTVDPLANKLFEILGHAASANVPSAQLGALAAIGKLAHPRTREFLLGLLNSPQLLNDTVKAATVNLLKDFSAQ